MRDVLCLQPRGLTTMWTTCVEYSRRQREQEVWAGPGEQGRWEEVLAVKIKFTEYADRQTLVRQGKGGGAVGSLEEEATDGVHGCAGDVKSCWDWEGFGKPGTTP